MSEFDRLKAQKDAIVMREREAIEAPLKARIGELTTERDGLREALQACERYIGNLVDEDTPSCALLLGRVRSALAALPGKENK